MSHGIEVGGRKRVLLICFLVCSCSYFSVSHLIGKIIHHLSVFLNHSNLIYLIKARYTFITQGKQNPNAGDSPLDGVKNPHHLVLISDHFTEARAALSRSTNFIPNNQSPVKVDTSAIPLVSGPSTASAPTGLAAHVSCFVILIWETIGNMHKKFLFVASVVIF